MHPKYELPYCVDGLTVQEVLIGMKAHGLALLGSALRDEIDGDAITWNAEIHRLQKIHLRPYGCGDLKDKILNRWTEPNNLVDGHWHPSWLYSSKRKDKFNRSPLDLDHTRVWKQDRRLLCVTTEPYQVSQDQLSRIAELCDVHNLSAYFHYAAEVHNPGDCIGLVFLRSGDEHKIKTLETSRMRVETMQLPIS